MVWLSSSLTVSITRSSAPRSETPQGLKPRPLRKSVALLISYSLGLARLPFHDLRHDAASSLAMAGVGPRPIMELLGHRDRPMTVRYQHLAPGHLRDAMQALEHAATAHRAQTEETRGFATPRFEMVDDTGLEPVTPGM